MPQPPPSCRCTPCQRGRPRERLRGNAPFEACSKAPAREACAWTRVFPSLVLRVCCTTSSFRGVLAPKTAAPSTAVTRLQGLSDDVQRDTFSSTTRRAHYALAFPSANWKKEKRKRACLERGRGGEVGRGSISASVPEVGDEEREVSIMMWAGVCLGHKVPPLLLSHIAFPCRPRACPA